MIKTREGKRVRKRVKRGNLKVFHGGSIFTNCDLIHDHDEDTSDEPQSIV